MRKTITKTLSLLCMLCIIICSAFTTAGAASYPNDVKTESDSILLVNMDSGQTVYEKDADSKRYPASTTKIMTYIIAVENIADLDNTKFRLSSRFLMFSKTQAVPLRMLKSCWQEYDCNRSALQHDGSLG